MKKVLFYFPVFISVIAAGLIILSGKLPADSEPGKETVLDYYLLIPDEYFGCETNVPLGKNDRLALIKKKDLANGYILAATKDGGFPVEAAVYKDDFLGITVLAVNVWCGSGCMCNKLDFFFITNSKLSRDNGGFIFPKAGDIEKKTGISEGYRFVLPGDGKGINVVKEGSGKVLLKIEWSGGTFNLP